MGKHFSFVHCADLHLGEPFRGLHPGERGPWTEAIGKATFKAFEKVVSTAIESRVNALLISGDVYNSTHHSLAAQMAFARELYRAAQQGIQIFIVHGNHDPAEAWRADIPLPPSVHIFKADKVEGVPLLVDGELAATVYGISYGTRHVEENLAVQFKRHENDGFAIGMLHTDVGTSAGPYAPCTVEDLVKAKMDYWALGHVHTRKELGKSPYIIYPGNTQGLDQSETGPRGCYLVDVGAYGTVTLKFIETDAVQWVRMTFDISQFADQEELLREIMKQRAALKEKTGRPDIVRLVFTGRGPLHKAVSSPSGQEFILQSLNEKEQFRHIFAYFSGIDDETKPDLDLSERRQIPDIAGDYLGAYDKEASKPEKERAESLEAILEAQPEWKRISALKGLIDPDMQERAFRKAELLGAEMLTEEES